MKSLLRYILIALMYILSVHGVFAELKINNPISVYSSVDDANFKTDDYSALYEQANTLLKDWVDTLLEKYQLDHSDKSIKGGLLCPACGRIHGRCGDTVYPIMYLAHETGDKKYLEAAKALMSWMDNIHLYNGSWMNDLHVSSWNGTTVFMAIALAETLGEFNDLLDDSTRIEWESQLLAAGEFISANDIYFNINKSRKTNRNVNYSASAAYALYKIGSEFNRSDFIEKAKQIADNLENFFSEKNHFLYGEGTQRLYQTKYGCYPVDLVYNVEESLPNLIMYALLSKNDRLLDLVSSSLMTHIEFMLPDGAWDNSWGTRSYKWTYWGGRTSDGCQAGLYKLTEQFPVLTTVITQNLKLLQQATHNGLLQGGMHYHQAQQPTCIHHTFSHAKALASLLSHMKEHPINMDFTPLPRTYEYGAKFFEDIRTWLVAKGDWRATVTSNDAEYKTKGTHPMGGVLSMLWHPSTGPIFAAGMNDYTLVEATNMQMDYQEYKMSPTPRIEFFQNNKVYSNMDDLETDIICDTVGGVITFNIQTHLVDKNQQFSSLGAEPLDLKYVFEKDMLYIEAQLPKTFRNNSVRLVLPVIAAEDEAYRFINDRHWLLNKGNSKINIKSDTPILIAPSNNGKIFNFIPGFLFTPLIIEANQDGKINVNISVLTK